MTKLVKTFIGQIGGIAAKVTGGDFFGEADTTKAESDVCLGAASSSSRAKSPLDKLSLSSGDVDEDRESHGGGTGESTPEFECPVRKGYLSKWTNYLHGWQERYVVVAEGIMSYYKSEYDTQYGCRGSISLHQVKILLHEFDDLRFDIRVHDCTYFFRASTHEEKALWVEVVEENKRYLADAGFAVSTIRRHGSILSLSAISQTSSSSFKMGHDFHTKLAEMETYRDILCRQVDVLQAYFDSLAEHNSSAKFNGVHQSNELFEELPEEDSTSDSELPKTTSTPESTKSSTLLPPTSHPSIPSHPSPLTHRSHQSKGHRRTGSDPFSFTKPRIGGHQHSNYHSHVKMAIGGGSLHNGPINVNNIDFRGEAITFKATTAGILASLSHCIETMAKREDYWQKKCEKEVEKRRKAELAAHAALNGPRVRAYQYAGPDFEEGPHSALNEEEFFDALEMAYQSEELEHLQRREEREATPDEKEVTSGQQNMASLWEDSAVPEAACPEEIQHRSITGITHRMTPVIGEKVSQYARYLFEAVDTNWNVVYEDGDMKVYRRELEEGGVVVDPLKSFYTANSISAREVSNFFFDFDTRMEWEGTIESADIVETLCEDTIIFHHMHKRVWPSTQRETLFCSHLCTLPNAPRAENQVGHTWMVCNFSVEHPKVPINNKLIRATFQIGLVCQTVANKPVERGTEAQLTRDDICCKILYAANVNPGGWAPPSVVRTIGKREITKFLRRFSSTAHKKTASSPLSL